MPKSSIKTGAGDRRDERIEAALTKGIEKARDRKSGMDLMKEALSKKTKWNDGTVTKR